jgi:hypothetical protein
MTIMIAFVRGIVLQGLAIELLIPSSNLDPNVYLHEIYFY